MAENPIKLFSTISERYPQPSDVDAAHVAARGLVSMIPIVGGPIDELLSLVLAPSVSRRRDEWFKELADVVEEMDQRVANFKIEDIEKNEAFISATIQATRIAAGTHKAEKRKILRNALLNIALGTGPDDDTQHIFLNTVDAFTASHVRVLDVLWRGPGQMAEKRLWDQSNISMNARNYGTAIELLVPELKSQNALVEYILTDLRSRGFTQLNSLSNNFPQGGTITNVGIQFMRFVLHPNELP
jgi:hypothetical protein